MLRNPRKQCRDRTDWTTFVRLPIVSTYLCFTYVYKEKIIAYICSGKKGLSEPNPWFVGASWRSVNNIADWQNWAASFLHSPTNHCEPHETWPGFETQHLKQQSLPTSRRNCVRQKTIAHSYHLRRASFGDRVPSSYHRRCDAQLTPLTGFKAHGSPTCSVELRRLSSICWLSWQAFLAQLEAISKALHHRRRQRL
jgi:hypothetical protein